MLYLGCLAPDPCPVCAAPAGVPLETHKDLISGRDYSIFDCPGCGLVYACPLRFPGADWYAKFNYHEGYQETADEGAEGRFRLFLDRLPIKEGRALDIGCADGAFVKMASERGFRAEGLEVDARFAEAARKRGLTIREGLLDDAFARENAGAYAMVSIFEVYEHVDDPKDTLRRIKQLLEPGGYLLLSVPDNRRPTPFGRDLWDYPPHHLTRWSPPSLRKVLEEAGFAVERMDTEPLIVWEFSRIWADRSARWILKTIKALLFRGKPADKPMAELLEESGGCACMPEKSSRVKLVSLYHAIFHVLTCPAFWLYKQWYSLAQPGGLRLLVIARKPRPIS